MILLTHQAASGSSGVERGLRDWVCRAAQDQLGTTHSLVCLLHCKGAQHGQRALVVSCSVSVCKQVGKEKKLVNSGLCVSACFIAGKASRDACPWEKQGSGTALG